MKWTLAIWRNPALGQLPQRTDFEHLSCACRKFTGEWVLLEQHLCLWGIGLDRGRSETVGRLQQRCIQSSWVLWGLGGPSELSPSKARGLGFVLPSQPINGFKLRAILGERFICESLEASLQGSWGNKRVGPAQESEQCTIVFSTVHSLCHSDILTSDNKFTAEFKFVSSSRKTYEKKVSGRNYTPCCYSWSGNHKSYLLFPFFSTIIDSFLLKRVAYLVT